MYNVVERLFLRGDEAVRVSLLPSMTRVGSSALGDSKFTIAIQDLVGAGSNRAQNRFRSVTTGVFSKLGTQPDDVDFLVTFLLYLCIQLCELARSQYRFVILICLCRMSWPPFSSHRRLWLDFAKQTRAYCYSLSHFRYKRM